MTTRRSVALALVFAIALVLLFAASALAQGPGAFTTVTTTNTSATSLRVGCAVGSTTCTGGIKAGPIDVSQVVSSGFIEIANNVPGVTTNRLYNDGGTLKWAGSTIAIGGAVGPGTTGKIAKFTAANAIADSIMTEAGTTITVASTLNATTLGGTLSTASQPNVTGVGTIGTGVWQGTIVGLTYGGTGSNLAGTGGTSQFLRQNSAGAAVTVVRPAVSDLSDASNVALKDAANVFTVVQRFSGPIYLAATQPLYLDGGIDTYIQEGSANRVVHVVGGSTKLDIQDTSTNITNALSVTGGSATVASASATNWVATATGGNVDGSFVHGLAVGGWKAIGFDAASGLVIGGYIGSQWQSVLLYTAGVLRFGVTTGGNWTRGGTIMDSVGTPSISSGGGAGATVVGKDYAFRITIGTGYAAGAAIYINFGNTWSNVPVCTATDANQSLTTSVPTTTQWVGGVNNTGAGNIINVICRGY